MCCQVDSWLLSACSSVDSDTRRVTSSTLEALAWTIPLLDLDVEFEQDVDDKTDRESSQLS